MADLILSIELDPTQIERNLQTVQARVGQGIGQVVAQAVQQSARQISEAAERAVRQAQRALDQLDRQLRQRRISLLPPTERVEIRGEQLAQRVREFAKMRILTEEEAAKRIAQIQTETAEWRWRQETQTAIRQLAQLDRIIQRRAISFLPKEEQLERESQRLIALVRSLHERGVISAAEASERISRIQSLTEQQRMNILAREEARREQARAREIARQTRQAEQQQRLLERTAEQERRVREREAERNRRMLEREAERSQRILQRQQAEVARFDRELGRRRLSLLPPQERIQAEADMLIARTRQLVNRRVLTEQEGARRIEEIQRQAIERQRQIAERGLPFTGGRVSIQGGLLAVAAAFAFVTRIVERLFGFIADRIQSVRELQERLLEIAAVIATFDRKPGTFLERFAAAKSMSDEILQRLIEIDTRTIGTLDDVVKVFQALIQTGIAVREALDVTEVLTNAIIAVTRGQDKERQLYTEIYALVDGQVRAGSRLARIIRDQGVDLDRQVPLWIATNRFAEEISTRLAGFAIAGEEFGKTITGLVTRIQSQLKLLTLETFADSVEAVKAALGDVLFMISRQGVEIRAVMQSLSGLSVVFLEGVRLLGRGLIDVFSGPVVVAIKTLTAILRVLPREATAAAVAVTGLLGVLVPAATTILFLATAAGTLSRSLVIAIARFGGMTLAGAALTAAMAALAGRFDQTTNQIARWVISLSAVIAGLAQLRIAISTIIAVGVGFVPILRIVFAVMSLFTGLTIALRGTAAEANNSRRSLEGIVESIDAIRGRLHALEAVRGQAGKGALDAAYVNQLLIDSVIALTASEKLQLQNLKDRQKQEEYLRGVLQRRLEQEKALAEVQLGQKLRDLSRVNEQLAKQWQEFGQLAEMTGRSVESVLGKTQASVRKTVSFVGTATALEVSRIGFTLSDSTQQVINRTEELAGKISETTPAFERELAIVLRTAQALDMNKEQLIALARASGATEAFIQKLSASFDQFSKNASQSSTVVSSFVFQLRKAFEQSEEFKPDLSESLIRTRQQAKELAVEFQNVRRFLETEPVGAETKPLPSVHATREAARLLGKQLDELRHRVRVLSAQGEDAFAGLTEEQRQSLLAAFKLREQMDLVEESIRRTSRPMRTLVDLFEQARERLNSLVAELAAFSGKMPELFGQRLEIEVGIEKLEAVRSLIDRIIKSKAILGQPLDLEELRIPDPRVLLESPQLLADTMQRLEVILGEVTARVEAWRQQQERALEPIRGRLELENLQRRQLEREIDLETRIGIERERARIQLAEEIETLRARNALLQEAERQETVLGAKVGDTLRLWAEETVRQENLQLAQELRRRRLLTAVREQMREEMLLAERARVERLEALEEADRQRIVKEQALASRIETIHRELSQRLADVELDRQSKRIDQILELITLERDLASIRAGDLGLRAIAVEGALVERRRRQLEVSQSVIAQENILNALRRGDVAERLAAAEADLDESRREAISTLEQLMSIEARLARFRSGDPELRAAVLDAERLRRRKEELQVLEDMIIVEDKLRRAGEIRTEVLNAKVLEHLKNAKDLTEILQDAQLNLFRSIESAFDNVIDRATQKLGIFRDFASTLLKDIAQFIIRQVIGPLFGGLGKITGTFPTSVGAGSPVAVQTAANTTLIAQQQGQMNVILNTIAIGIQQAVGILSGILNVLGGTQIGEGLGQSGNRFVEFFTRNFDLAGQLAGGAVGIAAGSITEQLVRVQQLLAIVIKRLEAILQALVAGAAQNARGMVNFTTQLLGMIMPSMRVPADLFISSGFPTARPPIPGGGQQPQPQAGGLGARLGQMIRGLITSPHFFASIGLGVGAVLGGPGVTGVIGGIAGGVVGLMVGRAIAGAIAGGTSVFGSLAGMVTTAATAIPFFGALAALIAMPFISRAIRRGREKREAARSAEQMFANIRTIIEQVRLDLLEGDEARQQVQEQWAQWENFVRTTLKDRTVQERSLTTQRPFFEQHVLWLESEILAQQRRKTLGQRAVPEFQRGGLVPFAGEPGELVIPAHIAEVVGLDALGRLNATGLAGIDLERLIKILIALMSAGRIPGTKKGTDSVVVLGEAGSFVINRRVSDEILKLLPGKLTGGFLPVGTVVNAQFGGVRGYQTGGSVTGSSANLDQLLGLLLPLLLQLLGLNPALAANILPFLLGLLSGDNTVITEQIKRWIINWLSAQDFFKSLPESVRNQIINAINRSRNFQELFRAISTPQFLADLGTALFSRLPFISNLPAPLREIVTSLLGSVILARGDIGAVIRSPATLGVITQALLRNSRLFRNLSDEEKQKLLGAIQLGFHPSGFQPEALLQIVGTLLPGLLERFGVQEGLRGDIATVVTGLLRLGLVPESPFKEIVTGALPFLPLAMTFASAFAERNPVLGLLSLFAPFVFSAFNVRRRQQQEGGTAPGQPAAREQFMRTIQRMLPILAVGGLVFGLLPGLIGGHRLPGDGSAPPRNPILEFLATFLTTIGTVPPNILNNPPGGLVPEQLPSATTQRMTLPTFGFSAPSVSRPVGFGVGFGTPALGGGGGEFAPVSINARTAGGPVVLNVSNFIVVGAETAREMAALAADDIVTIVEARSRRRG